MIDDFRPMSGVSVSTKAAWWRKDKEEERWRIGGRGPAE